MAQKNIINDLVDSGYEISFNTSTTRNKEFTITLNYGLNEMNIKITDLFMSLTEFEKLCDEQLLRIQKNKLEWNKMERISLEKQIETLETKLSGNGS